MDRSIPTSNHVDPGISIRHGPVEKMDIDDPAGEDTRTNGVTSGKRKSRQSMTNGKSYKEASSDNDEDDKPLVN